MARRAPRSTRDRPQSAQPRIAHIAKVKHAPNATTQQQSEIDDDDDIPELMIVSIIDELRRFFRLEGLEMSTGEE